MWSGLSLIHLGVPLLLSMRDSRRWAEARVVALYICVLLLDNAPGEPFIYASYWFDPDAAGVMQIVSFLAACGLLARAARPEVRLATPARWIGRRLLRAHR